MKNKLNLLFKSIVSRVTLLVTYPSRLCRKVSATLAGFFFSGEKYAKEPLTFDQQADLLLSRGLVIPEKGKAVTILSQINYYRLSAYYLPFQVEKDKFKEGVTFSDIYRLYEFDEELRNFLFPYLKKIEIALRTDITYELAHKYGKFCLFNKAIYSKEFSRNKWKKWLKEVKKELRRAHEYEEFIMHYRRKYKAEKHVPVWMITEVITFGPLSTLYSGLRNEDKEAIARKYKVPHQVFKSWLHHLCYVRNVCAHHARLWNREFAIKPKIPNSMREWHDPVTLSNKRVFASITILNYLLKAKRMPSRFKEEFAELLGRYSEIPRVRMGIIENWESHKMWE